MSNTLSLNKRLLLFRIKNNRLCNVYTLHYHGNKNIDLSVNLPLKCHLQSGLSTFNKGAS